MVAPCVGCRGTPGESATEGRLLRFLISDELGGIVDEVRESDGACSLFITMRGAPDRSDRVADEV